MAKTAKPKKGKQISEHSRAARRAVSPSINVDKSLKNLPRPDSPSSTKTAKPHVLSPHTAGISKRTKSKPLKHGQRLRKMKAMDKAADAMDKLELRRQRSLGNEKKVKERKKAWEDVNGRKKEKSANAFGALGDMEDPHVHENREWVSDEEMPEEGGAVQEPPESTGEVSQVVVPQSIPLPKITPDEEDEML